MDFPIRDPEHYRWLQSLPLDEASKTFLDSDFTIGEETALFEAVHRGVTNFRSLDEVEEILSDCLGDEADFEECKKRLMGKTSNRAE